jgi:iron complex outermembrane receptor protein
MHGNYASKHVDGGFYFRNPNTRGAVFSGDGGDSLLIGDLQLAETGVSADCPEVPITDNVPDSAALAEVFAREECFSFREIFPGGFTPRFGGDVTDAAFAAGVRGEMENGLRWDVSVGAGLNDVDFFINNTVNASLGPATPTEFNPGDYTQIEQMLNIDFAYSPTPTTKPRRCARRRLNSGFASTTSSSAS